jgi:hypothetical protein
MQKWIPLVLLAGAIVLLAALFLKGDVKASFSMPLGGFTIETTQRK